MVREIDVNDDGDGPQSGSWNEMDDGEKSTSSESERGIAIGTGFELVNEKEAGYQEAGVYGEEDDTYAEEGERVHIHVPERSLVLGLSALSNEEYLTYVPYLQTIHQINYLLTQIAKSSNDVDSSRRNRNTGTDATKVHTTEEYDISDSYRDRISNGSELESLSVRRRSVEVWLERIGLGEQGREEVFSRLRTTETPHLLATNPSSPFSHLSSSPSPYSPKPFHLSHLLLLFRLISHALLRSSSRSISAQVAVARALSENGNGGVRSLGPLTNSALEDPGSGTPRSILAGGSGLSGGRVGAGREDGRKEDQKTKIILDHKALAQVDLKDLFEQREPFKVDSRWDPAAVWDLSATLTPPPKVTEDLLNGKRHEMKEDGTPNQQDENARSNGKANGPLGDRVREIIPVAISSPSSSGSVQSRNPFRKSISVDHDRTSVGSSERTIDYLRHDQTLNPERKKASHSSTLPPRHSGLPPQAFLERQQPSHQTTVKSETPGMSLGNQVSRNPFWAKRGSISASSTPSAVLMLAQETLATPTGLGSYQGESSKAGGGHVSFKNNNIKTKPPLPERKHSVKKIAKTNSIPPTAFPVGKKEPGRPPPPELPQRRKAILNDNSASVLALVSTAKNQLVSPSRTRSVHPPSASLSKEPTPRATPKRRQKPSRPTSLTSSSDSSVCEEPISSYSRSYSVSSALTPLPSPPVRNQPVEHATSSLIQLSLKAADQARHRKLYHSTSSGTKSHEKQKPRLRVIQRSEGADAFMPTSGLPPSPISMRSHTKVSTKGSNASRNHVNAAVSDLDHRDGYRKTTEGSSVPVREHRNPFVSPIQNSITTSRRETNNDDDDLISLSKTHTGESGLSVAVDLEARNDPALTALAEHVKAAQVPYIHRPIPVYPAVANANASASASRSLGVIVLASSHAQVHANEHSRRIRETEVLERRDGDRYTMPDIVERTNSSPSSPSSSSSSSSSGSDE